MPMMNRNKHSDGIDGPSRSSTGEKHGVFPPHRRSKPLSPMLAHAVAAVAEFVGTFMFLFLAFAGHLMAVSQADDLTAAPTGFTTTGGISGQPSRSSTMSNQTVLVISLAYAISLLVNVWAFYRISGGLFNPAVTLGLAITGHVPWVRAAILVPTQLLGSIVAAAMARALFPIPVWHANTTLSGGTTTGQGLVIEMLLTAELVFVILMLAQEKSRDTFIAPIGIGLAMLSCMIPGIFFTGGSLNPARSLGPAVAGGRFPGYHWIYWVGPVLGACIAAGYYHFVKYFRYEEVNPGQDTSRPLTPEPESDPRSAGSKNGTNHTDDSSYRV